MLPRARTPTPAAAVPATNTSALSTVLPGGAGSSLLPTTPARLPATATLSHAVTPEAARVPSLSFFSPHALAQTAHGAAGSPFHTYAPLRTVTAAANTAASAVTAYTWRASAALRQSHRLCQNCKVASPVAQSTCPYCHVAFEDMQLQGSAEDLEAHAALAASSAYFRNLVCAQGRSQPTQPGTSLDVDDPQYGMAARQDVMQFGRETSAEQGLLDEYSVLSRNSSAVVLFDSWLTFSTEGRYSIIGEENVKAFCAHEHAGSMFSQFLISVGSVIKRTLADGSTETAHSVSSD